MVIRQSTVEYKKASCALQTRYLAVANRSRSASYNSLSGRIRTCAECQIIYAQCILALSRKRPQSKPRLVSRQ